MFQDVESLRNKWTGLLSLEEYKQKELLQLLSDPNNSNDSVLKLLLQLESVEKNYTGGVLKYVSNAVKLIGQLESETSPFLGYSLHAPETISLTTESEEFLCYEELGMTLFSKVAFVLVAGGVGERLGYSGIKIELPVDTITKTNYLDFYCQTILACQEYAMSFLQTNDKDTTTTTIKIPFAIMTSEETNKKTIELLKKNHYYGLSEDQIFILEQGKVPAFKDNNIKFSVKQHESSGEFELETKPHGHGDVHQLLNKQNLPSKWVLEGKKYIIFIQDTNALAVHAIAPLLGVSKKYKLAMNSLAVPRKPGEAVGAICLLKRKNNKDSPAMGHNELTINVEYNQLHALLKDNNMNEEPESKNQTSIYPGNTNVLCFYLPRYADTLKTTDGCIPEFVNPKYADPVQKTTFKAPARLECMMQEFPRLLEKSDKVGVTQLDRWLCFSTVKNNSQDAAVKIQNGLPPECPFSGEAEFYLANARLLEIAAKQNSCYSLSISKPIPTMFANVAYTLGPRVIILPRFGITLNQIKSKISSKTLKLFESSALILDGDVKINGLTVEGALKLASKPGCRLMCQSLTVQNHGVQFLATTNQTKEKVALIRGYSTHILEMATLVAE